MKTTAHPVRATYALTCRLLLCMITGLLPPALRAQTTLSTTAAFTNSETAATVTFNFENTNAYPVVITGIDGVLGAYGTQTVQLWYKTSAVSGAPGAIATGNGWTLSSSAAVNGTGNTTSTVTQPFFQGISLVVPANTTYGLAIAGYSGTAGSQRVGVLSGPAGFSAGGCTISTGPAAGYAATAIPPAAPTTSSRGWIGRITFMPATACTGAPAAAVISGPAAVCQGKPFSMSATGFTTAVGVTNQWQFYNPGMGMWMIIFGQTGATCTMPGIIAATQYRMISTCTASGLQTISNVLTVPIGSGLPGGTYTIDKNAPVSATNFVSFTDVTAALSCGISGPVVFDVAPGSGPYTEKITFNNVPGISATNTIRINGNGNTVQYMNSANDRQLLTLSNMSYLSIDSLTFKTLSPTYGWGALLTGNCASDSITRCFFDLASMQGGFFDDNAHGIVFSGALNATASTGVSAKNCYLGYNHIKGTNQAGGTFYGIFLAGSPQDSNNVVAYNEVENFSYCGIFGYPTYNLKILYNDIHRKNKVSPSMFYGISTPQLGSSGFLRIKVEISGNRVHDAASVSDPNATFYGISFGTRYSQDNTDIYDTVLVTNNVIYNVGQSGGPVYGLDFGNSSRANTYVYHNTVNVNLTSTGNGPVYGMYSNHNVTSYNPYDTTYVRNNLVSITGGSTGTKYGFYYMNVMNSGQDMVLQRNNIYVNSSQPGAQYYCANSGTNYPTIADFQAANPYMEAGSLSVDPQFLPVAGSLIPGNALLQGNGVDLQTVVSHDIDGVPRSVAPTPGAFEPVYDAGVTALVSPAASFCAGKHPVTVSLANMGQLPISMVTVYWSVNDIMQAPVTYSGMLDAGNTPPDTDTLTLGNVFFPANTTTAIKAWTSIPNGAADADAGNDTLSISLSPSFSLPVDLGADTAICAGSSLVLDAGNPGAVYVWDNGAGTQLRQVSAAGTYFVSVTAPDGCEGTDTLRLGLRA